MICPNCGQTLDFLAQHAASYKPQDASDYQCEQTPNDTRGAETLELNRSGQWTACPKHLKELVIAGNFDTQDPRFHFEIHVLKAPYCDICSMRGEGF